MAHSPCNTLTAQISMPSRSWARWLLDRCNAAQALHRQHQALLRLDDRLLRDIGMTRSKAVDLASGPVWNAPNHWKR